jgi:hypothetical protein
MRLTRRFLLQASGAFLAARLTGPAYPQVSGGKTVGSWRISGECSHADASLVDSAVAVSSGAIGLPPAQMHLSASLKIGCNASGTFEGGGSVVQVNLGADVPAFLMGLPLPVAVIADGKEVGRADARKPVDLSAVFGADLAKLKPVKTLEIAFSPPAGGGAATTIFKASLDQTEAALEFMRTIATSRPEPVTVGSWTLSAADGVATAAIAKSAIVTDILAAAAETARKPGAMKPGAAAELLYQTDLGFYHEWFFVSVDIPPDQDKDSMVRLVADGQEVQKRKAVFYQGELNIFQFELTSTFGKDLKGLVPIRNFKAILTTTGAETLIYEANLSQTAEALERMMSMAQHSKQQCAGEAGPGRIKRPFR